MIDALRELYQEVILDHGKHPRNFGKPESSTCSARGDNPMCGDRIMVYLKVDRDGIIQEATFDGRGCAISTASASMMTEVVKGLSVAHAKRLFKAFHAMCTQDGYQLGADSGIDEDAIERLQMLAGVREFPVRVKCATLAWHTLNAAVGEGADAVVSTE